MSKYIELIGKYRIEQSNTIDYSPPSYIWDDNTGVVVRCRDCAFWGGGDVTYDCPWDVKDYGEDPNGDDYCSKGERKK